MNKYKQKNKEEKEREDLRLPGASQLIYYRKISDNRTDNEKERYSNLQKYDRKKPAQGKTHFFLRKVIARPLSLASFSFKTQKSFLERSLRKFVYNILVIRKSDFVIVDVGHSVLVNIKKNKLSDIVLLSDLPADLISSSKLLFACFKEDDVYMSNSTTEVQNPNEGNKSFIPGSSDRSPQLNEKFINEFVHFKLILSIAKGRNKVLIEMLEKAKLKKIFFVDMVEHDLETFIEFCHKKKNFSINNINNPDTNSNIEISFKRKQNRVKKYHDYSCLDVNYTSKNIVNSFDKDLPLSNIVSDQMNNISNTQKSEKISENSKNTPTSTMITFCSKQDVEDQNNSDIEMHQKAIEEVATTNSNRNEASLDLQLKEEACKNNTINKDFFHSDNKLNKMYLMKELISDSITTSFKQRLHKDDTVKNSLLGNKQSKSHLNQMFETCKKEEESIKHSTAIHPIIPNTKFIIKNPVKKLKISELYRQSYPTLFKLPYRISSSLLSDESPFREISAIPIIDLLLMGRSNTKKILKNNQETPLKVSREKFPSASSTKLFSSNANHFSNSHADYYKDNKLKLDPNNTDRKLQADTKSTQIMTSKELQQLNNNQLNIVTLGNLVYTSSSVSKFYSSYNSNSFFQSSKFYKFSTTHLIPKPQFLFIKKTISKVGLKPTDKNDQIKPSLNISNTAKLTSNNKTEGEFANGRNFTQIYLSSISSENLRKETLLTNINIETKIEDLRLNKIQSGIDTFVLERKFSQQSEKARLSDKFLIPTNNTELINYLTFCLLRETTEISLEIKDVEAESDELSSSLSNNSYKEKQYIK